MKILMIKSTLLLSFLVGPSFALAKSSDKSFTFTNEKNKYHVMTTLMSQSTNIATEGSDTSTVKNADFSLTGQRVEGEYFINQQYSIVGGYYFGFVIDIDAEVQGFDVGVQYYPFSNGASKDISILGSKLSTSPEWAPYIYLGASTRDIQFSSVNLKFQGIEASGGTYWHFGENYFLKGNVFYQEHLNNNIRTLTTTGMGVGVGMKF